MLKTFIVEKFEKDCKNWGVWEKMTCEYPSASGYPTAVQRSRRSSRCVGRHTDQMYGQHTDSMYGRHTDSMYGQRVHRKLIYLEGLEKLFFCSLIGYTSNRFVQLDFFLYAFFGKTIREKRRFFQDFSFLGITNIVSKFNVYRSKVLGSCIIV